VGDIPPRVFLLLRSLCIEQRERSRVSENAANVALCLPGGAVSPCLPMRKMPVPKAISKHACLCTFFFS